MDKKKILTIAQTITGWLVPLRFALLAVFLFLLMFLFALNGQWIADFWVHSAAVRELITNISDPSHHQLLLDVPFPGYSPYTLAVAFFGKLLNVEAISILSAAGILNLVLFILGLRMFVYATITNHKSSSAFYALLLTLFWWGFSPWYISGFFHIGVLGYVMPYPSTFAMALSLITLSLNQRRIQNNQRWLLPAEFLLTIIVLISHLPTFVFLAVGLISFVLTAKKQLLFEVLIAVSILAGSLLLSAIWPYFSMLNFLLFESAAYHISHQHSSLYQQILSRTWPALAALPLVVAKIRANPRYPLTIMLLLLSGVYIFGAITGMGILGRTISYIMLLLQFFIAEFIADFETRKRLPNIAGWLQPLLVSAGVVLVCLLLFGRPFGRTVKLSLPGRPSTYQDYLFLSDRTAQYDVILADLDTSEMVPAFGGKVVALDQPLSFVPDYSGRQSDVERFFTRQVPTSERLETIEKYKVDYLLVNKHANEDWEELVTSFSSFGVIDYENDLLVLISLARLH